MTQKQEEMANHQRALDEHDARLETAIQQLDARVAGKFDSGGGEMCWQAAHWTFVLCGG